MSDDASIHFDDPDLRAHLDRRDTDVDALDFGLVVMDADGKVTSYNREESRLSGLDPERVVGRHFFTEVGPCTNNFMVAQRYEDEDDLDETIEYVFTFKMAPTPVRLRMMTSRESDRRYLAIVRR